MRPQRVKEQTVRVITDSGESQELGVKHAERLLDMGPELNGGWKLPKDSKYEYTEEYGLRLKSNKGNTAEA